MRVRTSPTRVTGAIAGTAAIATAAAVSAMLAAPAAGASTTADTTASTVAANAAYPAAYPAASTAASAQTLTAPSLTVLRRTATTGRGYLFTAPKVEGNRPAGTLVGPLISDNRGRPVWFRNLPNGVSATDFRVQRYEGHPVLTYWQGTSLAGAGHGEGVDVILNQHYRVIATVRAGLGDSADQHEFFLTGRNTALITSYKQVTVNASSVGGPKRQAVLEGVVQEIDVRTGRVLLDWQSLQHVPLRDSHQPLPTSASTPWDYFHVNAVRPDVDGNLLVSARHTWTIYKIARHTGRVIWELGGRQSSFVLGRGVRFAWQHDPEPQGHGNYRIFDNEFNGTTAQRPQTRIITVHVNLRTHRATLIRVVTHPDHLLVPSQGNAQLLPDGHLVVGWGALGRVSEFDANGRLIFDATVPAGEDTYRAFRSPWVGLPLNRPTLALTSGTGHIVWNGATQVRVWRIQGGATPTSLHAWRIVWWNGLNTAFAAGGAPKYLRALAYDGHGHLLGSTLITTS